MVIWRRYPYQFKIGRHYLPSFIIIITSQPIGFQKNYTNNYYKNGVKYTGIHTVSPSL